MALLDLLPLVWLLALVLALALLRRGERRIPARVLPAASGALAAHLRGQPPRVQSAVFLAAWLLCAIVWTIAARILRRRNALAKGPCPSGNP